MPSLRTVKRRALARQSAHFVMSVAVSDRFEVRFGGFGKPLFLSFRQACLIQEVLGPLCLPSSTGGEPSSGPSSSSGAIEMSLVQFLRPAGR